MLPIEPVGFHFAQPFWLWLMLVPIVVWLLPPGRRARRLQELRLKSYAEPHLMPHLLIRGGIDRDSVRRYLRAWTWIWLLGCIALAGPRWDYHEIEVFQPGSDVVVLLDLSRSMEAMDVKPSRLARARQEIEDLLDMNPGARVGLIAFATVSHVIAPITEDMQTLRHLLPSLSPSLIQLQGSRLSGALERARILLAGQPPGNSKAVLLLSDGDFNEPELEQEVARLRAAGIRLYVLGIGLTQGSSIPGPQGGWLQDAYGQRVVSRLEEDKLQALARAGDGFYRQADYRDDDTQALLERIRADAPPRLERNPLRIWHERYMWLVAVMLFLLLSLFRRGRGVL